VFEDEALQFVFPAIIGGLSAALVAAEEDVVVNEKTRMKERVRIVMARLII
jgi:hypothetical protein